MLVFHAKTPRLVFHAKTPRKGDAKKKNIFHLSCVLSASARNPISFSLSNLFLLSPRQRNPVYPAPLRETIFFSFLTFFSLPTFFSYHYFRSMISYNPKDWLRFIFNFHKADTIRKLFPLMMIVALYSWGIAYLEMDYFRLSFHRIYQHSSWRPVYSCLDRGSPARL